MTTLRHLSTIACLLAISTSIKLPYRKVVSMLMFPFDVRFEILNTSSLKGTIVKLAKYHALLDLGIFAVKELIARNKHQSWTVSWKKHQRTLDWRKRILDGSQLVYLVLRSYWNTHVLLNFLVRVLSFHIYASTLNTKYSANFYYFIPLLKASSR